MKVQHDTEWWTELDNGRNDDHSGQPGMPRTVVNTGQMEELALGEWSNTGEVIDITGMGKWKWLTVHGCDSQSLVCTVMEFFKSHQDGGGMQQCAQGFTGVMLKNDDTSVE